MARLLVLGAGRFQLAGIRKAVGLGHEVHTADWDLASPGHALGHGGHEVSTTDLDGVVALARRLRPDGVCTFASDVSCVAVGRVTDELGLPGGASEAVATTLGHKGRFRQLQRAYGLPHPDFRVLPDGVDPPAGEWLLKPVDSSGSKGVGDDVADARAHSRCGEVIAERRVPGVEVGGDMFLVDGGLVHAAVTHKHLDGYSVLGHSLPPAVSEAEAAAAVRAVLDCASAAGHATGPINFDVFLDAGRATVLEMSPRTGGNGIPGVIERATGFDGEGAVIEAALGGTPVGPAVDDADGGELRACGSVVLEPGGDLAAVQALPEVFEAQLTDGGGYALFDLAPGDTWAAASARVREAARG